MIKAVPEMKLRDGLFYVAGGELPLSCLKVKIEEYRKKAVNM
jgi:hypothetical protein